jgi:hypothetical protein
LLGNRVILLACLGLEAEGMVFDLMGWINAATLGTLGLDNNHGAGTWIFMVFFEMDSFFVALLFYSCRCILVS